MGSLASQFRPQGWCVMKVVTVKEMCQIETASDQAGHSYAAMMELAGRSVADAIIDCLGSLDTHVLVLVGPGNNGGDGLVAARLLSGAGASVTCYLAKPREAAADPNFRKVLEMGLTVVAYDEDKTGERLEELVRDAGVVVDALLGTGTQLPVRGRVAKILAVVSRTLSACGGGWRTPLYSVSKPGSWIKPRRPVVVAVDGPSGLDYDTGKVDAAVLAADFTVTLAFAKVGHFCPPGSAATGELIVADIGVDPALASDVVLEVADPGLVGRIWSQSLGATHERSGGRATIVAGSVNQIGAAYLTGAAATRAGHVDVTVALPGTIVTAVASRLSEISYLILPDDLGIVGSGAARILADRLSESDALLVGPGLGLERETQGFMEDLVGGTEPRRRVGFAVDGEGSPDKADLPALVISADGLGLLAEVTAWTRLLPPDCILIPTPTEMARLVGRSVADVQSNRLHIAQRQASEWGHVVVLQGSYPVVAAPDGRVIIEPFASLGMMGRASGYVLAGVTVSLLAQGLQPFEAAAMGTYLYGLAVEISQQVLTEESVIAEDVLAHLPEAWRCLQDAWQGMRI